MPHNFKVGIDWNTVGFPALPGKKFVSKSGDNANDWSDPETPKIGVYGQVTDNVSVVVGTGLYLIGGNMAFDCGFEGDGHVILDGQNLYSIGTVTVLPDKKWDSVIFRKFTTVTPPGYYDTEYYGVSNCIFDSCNKLDFNHAVIRDCIIKDIATYVDAQDTIQSKNYRNSYFNTEVYLNNATFGGPSNWNNNYFHNDTILHIHVNFRDSAGFNSIIRGQIEVGGTTYANLAALRAAFPSALPDCSADDVLLLGDPAQYEFTVDQASPIIGQATGGLNIGGLKNGIIQNDSTTEFTTGATANNTAFNSGSLELSSGTQSYRETAEINMGRLIKSPTIRLNGIVDFVNHMPDALNLLVNPNHLDYQAQWAGKDGVYNGTWKTFRYNQPMYLNADGKTTGELDFDWSDLGEIDVRYIKIRVYIRDDYNEA